MFEETWVRLLLHRAPREMLLGLLQLRALLFRSGRRTRGLLARDLPCLTPCKLYLADTCARLRERSQVNAGIQRHHLTGRRHQMQLSCC